jgi:hypothetical protein
MNNGLERMWKHQSWPNLRHNPGRTTNKNQRQLALLPGYFAMAEPELVHSP